MREWYEQRFPPGTTARKAFWVGAAILALVAFGYTCAGVRAWLESDYGIPAVERDLAERAALTREVTDGEVGLGVSRLRMQRSYQELGMDFYDPQTLQDGRRSVAGQAADGLALVELIGPVANLTEITVITAATDSHARRFLAPALVEGLQFAPDSVEASIDAMLVSVSRNGSISLSGVDYPAVGELRLAREVGLLTLTIEVVR